jgi:hypothetical protein
MPNKFKGSFDIEIEGKDYQLRPTFDAMAELTTLTNKSEREIFEMLRSGEYTLSIVTDVIYCGIMGEYWASNRQAPKIDRRVLGQLVMMEGVTSFVPKALQFMMFAIVPYKTAAEAIEKTMDEAEEAEPEKKTVE